MRKWLNINFNFSKREFNGLLVLITLIMLVTLIPSVYELLIPEKDDLQAEISALRKLMQIEAEKNKPHIYNREGIYNKVRTGPEVKKIKLFDFDPNHANLGTWQLLGLSAKQAAVMIRYTEKGGRFHKKEDLQKMYVISPDTYSRLAPYIHIEQENAARADSYKSNQYNYAKQKYPARLKPVIISLNSADTLQLDQIKGIGPAFARRIFNYRRRLGGFHKKEQLLEVFGLDSVKYNEIKDQVSIGGEQLTKIKINTVEFAELRLNPYLDFRQVNAILQFRKQHGNYLNIADLKKVAILPAATVEKLAPYISFEHD